MAVAFALAVTVAVVLAFAVSVGFIGFGPTICIHQKIEWSPVCRFFTASTPRPNQFISCNVCLSVCAIALQ